MESCLYPVEIVILVRDRSGEAVAFAEPLEPRDGSRKTRERMVRAERERGHAQACLHGELRVLAVEANGRASRELHFLLLLLVRNRLPVIVDRARLVDDPNAGLLETIAQLQVLVSVAGKRLVEAAGALEVGTPHRCVSREEVEPAQALGRGPVQRLAQSRVRTLGEILRIRV